MIDDYSTGQMTVQGEKHQNDLKIIDGQVKGNWWRKEGHRLEAKDIEDVLSAKPDILVVGMGYASNMKISASVKNALKESKVQLYAENTRDAVKTFNHLYSKGKNVAGAFHLTC